MKGIYLVGSSAGVLACILLGKTPMQAIFRANPTTLEYIETRISLDGGTLGGFLEGTSSIRPCC